MATILTFESIRGVIFPSCTRDEARTLAKLESEQAAHERPDAEILADVTTLMMHQLQRIATDKAATAAATTAMPGIDPVTTTLLTSLIDGFKGLQRTQFIEAYAGAKDDDSSEQWIEKFEATSKLNGWHGDNDMMATQFMLHLKAPASDWYQENRQMLSVSTWDEIKMAFRERFKRSDSQVAMALQRIRQKPNQTVQQFAEQIGKLWAKFPMQPRGIERCRLHCKTRFEF